MSPDLPSLSIVVLAYNEEANVAPFVRETLAWLDTRPGEHRVVVVNDGSSDDTLARVQAVAEEDRRVHIVSHAANLGMGAGMRSGIAAATGDYFTILAADGQVPASALDDLLPELDRADIVTSVYARRANQRYRHVMSAGLRGLMWVVLGLDFRLEGIYLFPVHVARAEIGLDRIGAETFFFSFELISRAVALGYRIATVTIEPRAREHGASKVANLARIRRVAEELVRFRLRLLRER